MVIFRNCGVNIDSCVSRLEGHFERSGLMRESRSKKVQQRRLLSFLRHVGSRSLNWCTVEWFYTQEKDKKADVNMV
jgi:hypothetical protein